MPASKLLSLVLIFFFTSLISVVTGSTSLIIVPVMIEFGIDPHVAVATNMMALIFMSLGGSLPFSREGVIKRRLLPVSIVLTLVGSALGAPHITIYCQLLEFLFSSRTIVARVGVLELDKYFVGVGCAYVFGRVCGWRTTPDRITWAIIKCLSVFQNDSGLNRAIWN
jgi:Sulfite exporter TauE/SafE